MDPNQNIPADSQAPPEVAPNEVAPVVQDASPPPAEEKPLFPTAIQEQPAVVVQEESPELPGMPTEEAEQTEEPLNPVDDSVAEQPASAEVAPEAEENAPIVEEQPVQTAEANEVAVETAPESTQTEEAPKDLPPVSDAVAEAPSEPTADFEPKFEEANSTLDNVPVAAAGAFGAATAAAKSEPMPPKQPDPISANSQKAGVPATAAERSKNVLVLAATLVGIILAAIVIYIYVTSNKSVVSVSGTPSSQANITADDVSSSIDQTQQDIDSINDTELNDSDLSDSALGL